MSLIAKLAAVMMLLPAFAACVDKPLATSESIDTKTFTVSGTGEGAYLATHLHVAYSGRVTGITSIGGGPYDCAKGSGQRALGQCTDGLSFDVNELTHHARELAAAKKIDTLNHLANATVFVADLENAGRYSPELSYAVAEFYEEMVDSGEVRYQYSPEFDTACSTTAFNDAECRRKLLAAGMDHLYPRLPKPAESREMIVELPGGDRQLVLPATCPDDSACRLHVHFSNCANPEPVSFFQSLAKQYGIAILLVGAAPGTSKCWNWWGDGDAGYATREGREIRSVIQLIENL